MHELLDLTNIKNLLIAFQIKVQNNLLNLFTLDPLTKQQIANVDFDNCSFSTELYYLYFKSLIKKNLIIYAPTPDLFIENKSPVIIIPMNPKVSLADNYVFRDALMRDKTPDFVELFAKTLKPSAAELSTTKFNFQRALDLLCKNYPAANAKLLNSIAIFNDNYEISTSASSIFCQGRIYAKNVGDTFSMFYYLDTLVHELAHQQFNIIQNLHNFISDPQQTFKSYLKNQERPLYGILHGVFVLYRLIDFYSGNYKLLKSFSSPYILDDYDKYLYARFFKIPYNYEFRMQIYKQKLKKTLAELNGVAKLTAEGEAFIEYINNYSKEV